MAPKMDQYRRMKLEELVAMNNDIEAVIQEKKEAAIAEFRKEIEEKASSLGLDLGSIFGLNGAAKRKGPKPGGSAAIKYRDPKNPSNVWSGRGRPAKWLQEKIDEGHKKEEFLVAA